MIESPRTKNEYDDALRKGGSKFERQMIEKMIKEEENNVAEVTYARLVSHFSHHQTTNNREDDQVARMHSLSRVLDEFTGPVERRTMDVHSVVFIAKKLIERRCQKSGGERGG